MKNKIIEKNLSYLFTQATLGIEKEGQRISQFGDIVHTEHPTVFGDRSYHLYIQTDFAESQLELITPVCRSEQEVSRFLSAIHEVVLRNLSADEYILPCSVPMHLPDESAILEAQLSEQDTHYREYLSQKYGKYKQMVSGIHYNFGFTQQFLEALKDEHQSLSAIQNEVYMKLARQFIRYQWLLVYLFGASTRAPKSYFNPTDEILLAPVRSVRSSQYGYVNAPHIQVSFNTLQDYVKTLTHYVETGDLIAEKEFYSSVRFRGQKQAKDFLDKGIQYVELRIFDLNPYAPYGILEKDIRFIHLFVMLMLWLDEADQENAVTVGTAYKNHVALEHPNEKTAYFEEGLYLLTALMDMIKTLQLPDSDLQCVQEKIEQLENPHLTIASQLEQCDNLQQLVIDLAQQYKKVAVEKPFGLSAFSNMELSTQALMSDAIQYGVQLDILDEQDQFLKLTYNGQIEYVKNGNMTRLDTYISPLIMENKVVTKKVLSEHDLKVPDSIQIKTLSEAIQVYPSIQYKKIVIKPKSTNYGLGITIFKNNQVDFEDYKTAISVALKEDKEVMIEDFIEGTEYRFFVLENETKAVLLRVPANVVGDGVHTIKELVAIKNDSILRGDGKTTPLTQIEIGEIETIQLKEQGYTANSIVEKGVIVYLRANSNISTGGDSVDMTDAVHESYKQIAVEITKAMQAKICGVDLIIKDITKPANVSLDSYGIVEANFNPMMMMHIFPFSGKSRRLTTDVLQLLFKDLKVESKF